MPTGPTSSRSGCMRILGWTYLVGYFLDAVLSTGAVLTPALLVVSNVVSTVMILPAIAALVLGCIGSLRPRSVFVMLPLYWFGLMGFGMVLAVLLVLQIGAQRAAQ